MVPCLHQTNIYTKRKLRTWRDQKCIPLVGAITPLTCAGRQNTPSRGRRFGPRTESCLNWDGPITMVPCLHQGNIHTKRKLRAWREQKCFLLVGAITPLTCAGRQNTSFRMRRFEPRTESCLNWDGPIAIVPCLHQGNILNQKEATGIERPEMFFASRCNNPTYLCGPSSTPSRGSRYRTQNGKLPKFGRTCRHGIVFAPRKY